jgi:hypothetical protein
MRSPQQSPHSDTAPKGPTNPRTSAREPGTATCHTKSHVVPARTARLTAQIALHGCMSKAA